MGRGPPESNRQDCMNSLRYINRNSFETCSLHPRSRYHNLNKFLTSFFQKIEDAIIKTNTNNARKGANKT